VLQAAGTLKIASAARQKDQRCSVAQAICDPPRRPFVPSLADFADEPLAALADLGGGAIAHAGFLGDRGRVVFCIETLVPNAMAKIPFLRKRTVKQGGH
jgi:hypothetical protein